MPRPIRCRRVRFSPGTTHFKPAGVRISSLDEVVLTLGEFEALRLKDLEDMGQIEAAQKMDISQPTLNRLLKSGRKKIAEALVNGKSIKIEGGNYKMVTNQGQGLRRGFAQGRGAGQGAGLGSGRGRGRMGGFAAGPVGTCKCPSCGHEQPKQRGMPCTGIRCPKCGSSMVRK